MTSTKHLRQEKRPVGELNTPLGVFSTSADLSKLGSSQLRVTSPKKGKSQLFPKSIFTPRIEHAESLEVAVSRAKLHEPIVSAEGTNSETNLPIMILDQILIESIAMSIAVPGAIPIPRCEVFNLTTRREVISSPWRCLGSLVIKMVQKLFKEISKEKKKEILFKYFITKLPRPSKQWTLFSSFYKFISPKKKQKNRLNGITKR